MCERESLSVGVLMHMYVCEWPCIHCLFLNPPWSQRNDSSFPLESPQWVDDEWIRVWTLNAKQIIALAAQVTPSELMSSYRQMEVTSDMCLHKVCGNCSFTWVTSHTGVLLSDESFTLWCQGLVRSPDTNVSHVWGSVFQYNSTQNDILSINWQLAKLIRFMVIVGFK